MEFKKLQYFGRYHTEDDTVTKIWIGHEHYNHYYYHHYYYYYYYYHHYYYYYSKQKSINDIKGTVHFLILFNLFLYHSFWRLPEIRSLSTDNNDNHIDLYFLFYSVLIQFISLNLLIGFYFLYISINQYLSDLRRHSNPKTAGR